MRHLDHKCDVCKCTGHAHKIAGDSALSGVTYHNGYMGKICDIWHRKDDEVLFVDWLDEMKKGRSLVKNKAAHLKITPPYVVTHACVVELIFKMCKDLNQPADTRYRSVELFEKFITNQLSKVLRYVAERNDQMSEWNNNMPRISSQIVLRVVSCIQLASKYCAHSSIVRPKTALSYLAKNGQTCTLNNILKSEACVFRLLDYEIGVPTLLVFIDILLPLVRETIEDKIYTVCISVLDVLYLQRYEIFKHLGEKLFSKWQHQHHRKKARFTSNEFDGLYCGAACISSALKIYYPNDEKILHMVNDKLAAFIDRPGTDILTFSSIILQALGM